jgi:hypothetical protein
MNTNNSAAGRAGLRTVAIGQKVLISRSSTGDKASQFWLGTKLNLLPSRITKFILPELLYEALPNVPFISDLSTKSLLRKWEHAAGQLASFSRVFTDKWCWTISWKMTNAGLIF